LEYGDFDVAITVPSNHFVVCSGELMNKAEVLNQNEQAICKCCSDKTVLFAQRKKF
jgi:hypothetical protein